MQTGNATFFHAPLLPFSSQSLPHPFSSQSPSSSNNQPIILPPLQNLPSHQLPNTTTFSIAPLNLPNQNSSRAGHKRKRNSHLNQIITEMQSTIEKMQTTVQTLVNEIGQLKATTTNKYEIKIITDQKIGQLKWVKKIRGDEICNEKLYILSSNILVYKGKTENGVPNGEGKLYYTDRTCKGTVVKWKLEGQGEAVFKSGRRYTGEFKEGKYDGKGILQYEIGIPMLYYKGEFKDGKENGEGEILFTNGAKYEGRVVGQKLHGRGTFTFSKGSLIESYCGEFKNSIYDGQGVLKYINGHRYEGEFKDGLLDGNGNFYERNKLVYTGSWANGKYHGQGKLVDEKGTEYKGNFLNGSLDGFGTAIYLNGSKYEGYFKEGKFHGTGKMAKNGACVVGLFENGIFKGI